MRLSLPFLSKGAKSEHSVMYIDIFIGVVLLWAVFNGWRQGLLREIVSAGGWIAGIVLAILCYKFLMPYLSVDGSKLNIGTSIVAFLILCIIIPIVLGQVAVVATKTLKVLHLGWANSLAGAAVSVLKFGVLLSFAFNVMTLPQINLLPEDKTADSRLFSPTVSLLSMAKDFITDEVAGGKKKHPYDDQLRPGSRRMNDSTIIVDMNAKPQPKKGSKAEKK